MASQASFTPDEWTRVLASPIIAGLAITAADPSGLWGLAQEGIAGGWALARAKQDAGVNALVKAVAEGFSTSDTRKAAQEQMQARFASGGTASSLRDSAIAELRAVAAIIDAKAPEDATVFKTWLREVAQKAAEAAKEGSFLGFGGVAVSEAEKATLAEITSALSHVTSSVDAPAPESPSHALPENSQKNLDAKLDAASEESFPGSDPVSVRITK